MVIRVTNLIKMKDNEKKTKQYKYSIDHKAKETDQQFIEGAKIRSEGEVPVDYKIYRKVNGPGDDELIEDNQQVDLGIPGREQFYSAKPNTGNG